MTIYLSHLNEAGVRSAERSLGDVVAVGRLSTGHCCVAITSTTRHESHFGDYKYKMKMFFHRFGFNRADVDFDILILNVFQETYINKLQSKASISRQVLIITVKAFMFINALIKGLATSSFDCHKFNKMRGSPVIICCDIFLLLYNSQNCYISSFHRRYDIETLFF